MGKLVFDDEGNTVAKPWAAKAPREESGGRSSWGRGSSDRGGGRGGFRGGRGGDREGGFRGRGGGFRGGDRGGGRGFGGRGGGDRGGFGRGGSDQGGFGGRGGFNRGFDRNADNGYSQENAISLTGEDGKPKEPWKREAVSTFPVKRSFGGDDDSGAPKRTRTDDGARGGGDRGRGDGFRGRGRGDGFRGRGDGARGRGEGRGRGGFRGGRGGSDRGFERKPWQQQRHSVDTPRRFGEEGEEEQGEEITRKKKSWAEEGDDIEVVNAVTVKPKNLKWVNVKLRYWRIIVRNMAFKTKKEDLEAICTPHGEITEIVLPKCKDPRFPKSCAGYGFVQYKDQESAEKALKALNEATIHGRQIAADFAQPKDTYETVKHEEEADLKRKVKVEKEDDDEESDSDDEGEAEKEEEDEKMEQDESSGDDEEKEDDDEENEDEESDEDLDDMIDDEEEEEKKSKTEKPPRKDDQATIEGRAVFLRNLAFETTDEGLGKAMAKFGTAKLAVICKYADSGHSKGSGFVHFSTKEEAEKIVQFAESGTLIIDGRQVSAHIAVPRADAVQMEKERHLKAPKDNRNLLLARMGIVREGTSAAKNMSAEDAAARRRLVEVMRKKLENLHMFISPTRLLIHNLPANLHDAQLKQIAYGAAGPQSTVTECRIWRNMDKLDDKGKGRSAGFGFVAFSTHNDALACLQKLNNNPSTFSNEKRPIVEFSVENLKALQLRASRITTSKGEAPVKKQKKGKNAEELRANVEVTKEVEKTTAKLRKSGAKPLPLRMGAKNRLRNTKEGKALKAKKDAAKKKAKKSGKEGGEEQQKPGGAVKKPGRAAKKTLSKYLTMG